VTRRYRPRYARSSARSQRVGLQPSRPLAWILATVLVVAGLVSTTVAVTSTAEAAPVPDLSTSVTAQGPDDSGAILAGEDARLTLRVTNPTGVDGYNTSFLLLLPNGIEFVSGGILGTPKVYPSLAELPNSSKAGTPDDPLATVPDGYQVWVFEDVADLPAGATFTGDLQVRPSAAEFPVGSEVPFELRSYVSGVPALRPVFDGSTGVGGAAAVAETTGATGSDGLDIEALRIVKSEPSIESQLLRGVHDNPTVYTLTVDYTGEGDTTGVSIVDWLPAGLEFLGCGALDQTEAAPHLYDGAGQPGGTFEYPGAGPLGAVPAPADCIEPTSVATTASDLPAGLAPGVYTRVEWALADLTGGTGQPGDLSAAGQPGTVTIRYLAAVPLFENTLDFVTEEGVTTGPSTAGWGHTANLDNNNGASTRQGQGAGFGDGIRYDNLAVASGTYHGPVDAPEDAEVSDSDSEVIEAMDLRITKTVDTGAPGGSHLFRTGHLAEFTLRLDTGEYTTADQIVITDTIPNGLCPAIPAQTVDPTFTGDPLPADCVTPYPSAAAEVTGATVTNIDYRAATGVFILTLEPTATPMPEDHTEYVTYTVLMRDSYDTSVPWTGHTTSGDILTNQVEVEAWTESIPELDGVTSDGSPSGVPAYGTEDVADESSVDIESEYSGITKRVLPRDLVIPTAPADPTAATSCAVPPAGGWAQNLDGPADLGFRLGDVVCYELTVSFANEIDVRNPVLTDFLPEGVQYIDYALYSGPGGTSPDVTIDSFTQNGKSLQWLVGTPDMDGDRYVPFGSRLVIHVLGVVDTLTPNDKATLDKLDNLMKYRQENVLGEVFFYRDEARIQVEQGVSLLKGVRDVDGDTTRTARSEDAADGAEFGSNRDGIQVVQEEEVTYRIDIASPPYGVQNLVVWDVLPEGITADDVTAVTMGGVALDPGDPDYPTSLAGAYAGRSVVVWDGVALPADGQETLTYTVKIPVGIAVATELPNTAAITQYDVEFNTGETRSYYPEGSPDTTPRPAEDVIDGAGTSDESDVYLPVGQLTKQRYATEVGPNAGAGEVNLGDPSNQSAQAVQGELITWRYTVEIPAHTTVKNAVLRDRGTLTPGNVTYTTVDVDWSASAISAPYTAADFTLSPAGALTFPAEYTNTSDVPQTFEVELVAYLGDPTNSNSTTYTNQAQFRSDTWNRDATATVVYREPNPQIDKSATPATDLVGGQTVTYTLRATNSGTNRPTSWDTVVVDCVPASLHNIQLVGAPAGVVIGAEGTSCDIAPGTSNGTRIEWTIGALAGGATTEIQYTAELPAVPSGSDQYLNTATITGYTLPATVGGEDTTLRRGVRMHSDSQLLTVTGASIEKSVAPTSAPIGETVTYTLTATLPANVQFFDATIVDTLPAGVVFDTVTDWRVTGAGAPLEVAPTQVGQTLTWDLGDIPASAEPRTIEIDFTAQLTDGVVAPAPNNTVQLSWNRIDDDPSTRQTRDDSAAVTVVHPLLGIAKVASDTTPDPGQVYEYTVTVTNTGSSPAYNVVIEDEVPTGVVVDAATISHGGVLSGAHPTNGGGTITWNLAGPISHQPVPPGANQVKLTYEATLAPSSAISDGEALINTASVDHYESFPADGLDYDPANVSADELVEPGFPNIKFSKSGLGTNVAYVDSPFSWLITATNDGDGPAQTVTIVDTLPANWQFTSVASITVGGVPYGGDITPTVTGAGTAVDPQVVTWTLTPVAPATTILTPGQTIAIVMTATPQADALTDPGVTHVIPGPVVVRPPHTNEVSGEATDTSGATENASGSYAPDSASNDAFIHAADLAIEKTAAGPLIAGDPAATAWTITVRNNGPDTAVGPFRVTDEWGALPDHFTVTGYSGVGWSCAPIATSGFECERTNANDVLASGASFPVITVTARADAAFDPADSPVSNTAMISGSSTYDPDPTNNSDSDDLVVDFEADLVIDKQGPAAAPNAGGPISWTITVSNDGPSDSRSTAADSIIVSDEVPAGVRDVEVALPLPAGWSLANPGPFQPTDVIELVAADGYVLADGASVEFTLTATIDPSLVDGTTITNAATVQPGATTDPDPSNNESDVDTTPTTDTTIAIAKTRQVLDGGVWVDATADDVVVPGTTVSYLITVANTGIADARDIVVTDEVPAELSYDSFTSVTGVWTRTTVGDGPGVDQEFALTGNLAPGAQAALRVTFAVAPDLTGDIVNVALGDAANAPQVDDDDDSGTDRSADLSIVKSHVGSATAGTAIGYTLTVTNEGPSYSSGPIEITDTLPAGFSYATGSATVSIDGGAAIAMEPDVNGQVLTWIVGDDPGFELPVLATIVVEFEADVAPDVLAGSHLNTAAVDGPDDEDPTNNGANDPTTVVTSADLAIVKDVADPGPYIAGTTVDYTLTITNAGPSVARDAVVIESAPVGTTIVAMSSPDWTCDPALGRCETDILDLGTTTIAVTLAIASGVADGTDLENVANVDSATDDPDPSDNVDDETITVSTSADLWIEKTAVDADGVAPVTTGVAGTELRYLLTVGNDGPSDAVGPITVTDTLPAGLSFVGVASGVPGWTCDVDPLDASLVACEYAAGIPAGATAASLVIIVAIDPAQPLGPVTNVATASSPTDDPDPSDNADDETVDIEQRAELAIVKTHDADAVRIGDELEFSLVVTNAGPSVATGVVVEDTIPAGLEYIDAEGSDPAWTVVASAPAADGATTVTASLADPLEVGATAPQLRLTVMVHPEAYPGVVNVARVSADQPDSDPSDDSSADEVTVPAAPSLWISKEAVGQLRVGEEATYRITVGNTGLTEAPGPITIVDPLPEGLEFRSVTAVGATCTESDGTVECVVDAPLALGGQVEVRIVVLVGDAAYPTVVNTATLRQPSDVDGSGLPDASAKSPVQPRPSTRTTPGTGLPIAGPLLLGISLLSAGGLVILLGRRSRRS